MAKRVSASRGEFVDYAFTVAVRRYWNYRGYESDMKAMAALRRRFPRRTRAQYEDSFRNGRRLYVAAIKLVAAHLDACQGEEIDADRTIQRKLAARVPGFRASTYRAAVGWVYYWHHLR